MKEILFEGQNTLYIIGFARARFELEWMLETSLDTKTTEVIDWINPYWDFLRNCCMIISTMLIQTDRLACQERKRRVAIFGYTKNRVAPFYHR